MSPEEIIAKIDLALCDVEMSPETRKLLIELRNEVPKAKSHEERIQIGFKWFELITKVAHIVTTLSQT